MKRIIITLAILIIIITSIICLYIINQHNKVKIKIDNKINNLVYTVENNSKLSVYDSEYQDYIENSINELKKKKEYSISKPLMLINPYGTNMTGLYIYFKTNEDVAIEYTISVEDETIPDYSNMLVGDLTKIHEGQIIGLIQGKENKLILKELDKNLNIINQVEYIINLPYYDKDAIEKVNIVEFGNIEEITDGLFFPANIKSDVNNNLMTLGLYDNNGILRAQLLGNAEKFANTIQFTDNNEMIFASDNKNEKNIKVNKYGKIEDYYHKLKYTHEFHYVNNKLYFTNAGSDIIYEYDLETHKHKELFNFRNIMPEIYNEAMNYYYSVYPKEKETDDNDWLHCNSIDFVNENDVVVSCRERSSIFYIEDLFNEPKLKYIIGPEILWENTSFEDYLLTKESIFADQLGQHTIRVETDENLELGQYYLYLFNNNYANSHTISNEEWVDIYSEAGKSGNRQEKNSKYYKYLVDENKKIYKLIQNFDVEYTPTKGGVHKYNNNNLIIGAGNSLIYSEYNNNGDLIIKFSLEGQTNRMNRCEKYSFRNIWFGTLKEYKNSEIK